MCSNATSCPRIESIAIYDLILIIKLSGLWIVLEHKPGPKHQTLATGESSAYKKEYAQSKFAATSPAVHLAPAR